MIEVGYKRPFEVRSSLYPFASRWFERSGTRIHYLDEGSGQPVLFLHGNPTWSFLFREVIRSLTPEYRCIAPDYPGFGFSSSPEGKGYTPREHTFWILKLLEALNLSSTVIVGHDWGGPIGLRLSVSTPLKLSGIVLCNTWCWAPDWWLGMFSRVMGGRLGRLLIRRWNVFARWIVPMNIYRTKNRHPEVLEAYTRPFPTPESREPTWVFPRELLHSADWVEATRSRLDELGGPPVQLVWGMRDWALGYESYLRRWEAMFPDCGIDRVEDASHYVPEDRPERVAEAVRTVADPN